MGAGAAGVQPKFQSNAGARCAPDADAGSAPRRALALPGKERLMGPENKPSSTLEAALPCEQGQGEREQAAAALLVSLSDPQVFRV